VRGSPIKRRTEVKNTLLIGRIEGSKAPIQTHTPLIRYFINDIGRNLPRHLAWGAAEVPPKTAAPVVYLLTWEQSSGCTGSRPTSRRRPPPAQHYL
jgi:hypothetical protein